MGLLFLVYFYPIAWRKHPWKKGVRVNVRLRWTPARQAASGRWRWKGVSLRTANGLPHGESVVHSYRRQTVEVGEMTQPKSTCSSGFNSQHPYRRSQRYATLFPGDRSPPYSQPLVPGTYVVSKHTCRQNIHIHKYFLTERRKEMDCLQWMERMGV